MVLNNSQKSKTFFLRIWNDQVYNYTILSLQTSVFRNPRLKTLDFNCLYSCVRKRVLEHTWIYLMSLLFQKVGKVWRECRVAGWSMSCQCTDFRLAYLMSLWVCVVLSLHCWVLAPVAASHDAAGPFGWLLSDKGPFHHSQEFAEFVERYQQGFTTKYKIYRWVG